jgi:hypothetical protein
VKRFLLLFPLLFVCASAAAQTPSAPTAGATAEVDPLRCWWRSSAGSVRTGETFDVSLTCAVLDNEGVQVVPDESRLGAAVIQMAPFEIVGGSHPTDLRSGARRFFQYQYTLRIISPDAIGKDVALPPTVIHYAINSRVAANTAVKGRDLVYILPPMAIRVASMVPTTAGDIRDAAGENFGNVEAYEFRASVLEIVAISCVALGALMTIFVLVGLARRARRRMPIDERELPVRSILGVAAKELSAVQREREQQGWTSDLAARALAAARVSAAGALGKPASQRLADAKSKAGEGRLIVPAPLRGKRRVLSSATTANDLHAALAAPDGVDPARAPMLERLRDALTTFSVAQYGQDTTLDQSALDGALTATIEATGQVRADHTWVKTFLRQLRSGGTVAETRA